MKKRIIAANWKMNKLYHEALELANDINMSLELDDLQGKEIIIAAPFIYLKDLVDFFKFDDYIKVAAQNCSNQISGAYTGEISAQMLASLDVDYCIVGHSERRQYFNETEEMILEKMNLLLDSGIKPIYCCGETLQHRESNNHFKVIENQLTESVLKLDKEKLNQIVIAYEPVWAIGTGITATPQQAQEMHSFISNTIQNHFKDSSLYVPLLYGGSCNTKNAAELFALPNVDGGLIGGASLIAEDFIQICNLPS